MSYVRTFKFNEQSAIENMIRVKYVDTNNITKTIYSLAKYNYHVLKLGDKANYNHILAYIMENCTNIYEEAIYKDINDCIRSAKKYNFASIAEINITESEMKTIQALDNIKQEKAAFVVLAISKYFNALNDAGYDSAFLTNADICKMARITIPVEERDQFMQFAYDNEILYRHTYADSIIKKVTFVSHDENDEVVLRLTENDFKDLAYTYLAYLTPHNYRRCVRCGCWIKRNKRDIRLCEECNSKEKVSSDKIKTIECVDCGQTVYVSTLNTETCRCEACREKHLQKIRSNQNKRYYQQRKIQ